MQRDLTNGDVARIFDRIAAVMEIQGENQFKIRAYKNASETLAHLSEPVSVLARDNRLDAVPGFGEAIQAKIRDILSTGTTPLYERIKGTVPDGVIDMLELPGIGAKSVRQLWESLKIESVDALEAAARAGRLTELPGFGAKSVAKILDAIERGRRYANCLRIDEAEPVASSIQAALKSNPDASRVELTGALARRADSVDGIELIVMTNSPESVFDQASGLAQVASATAETPEEKTYTLHSGITLRVQVAEPPSFVPQLVRARSSERHWQQLEARASELGMRLTPSGLLKDGQQIDVADEAALYAALGLAAIPVELREGNGEIEAAAKNALPRLITLADIKGDLHAHTVASDGKAPLQDMIAAAKSHGYSYMAITDHSQSLAIAGGLIPDRLREQIRAVRDAEQSAGIRIYAGSEVDIRADGTMDYDDELLAELDFVIASAHMHNRQDRDAQTKRVIRAIENPHVDLIAHPTARLINRRDPFDIDMEAMISAAARTGTALEINAAPERLDLRDDHARLACQMGALIMIDTDAHAVGNYDLMSYGIDVARRAWLTAEDVLNTRSLQDFELWLNREK